MRLPDGRGDSPDPLITRVVQNSLQAFYKRFSGPERTQMSDRQGADARRDATSGHFVCFSRPGAGALDQESPGSIPGGAIIKGRSAVAGGPSSLTLVPRRSVHAKVPVALPHGALPSITTPTVR